MLNKSFFHLNILNNNIIYTMEGLIDIYIYSVVNYYINLIIQIHITMIF